MENVLLPPNEFSALMSARGVSSDQVVVAYDDQWGLAAARLDGASARVVVVDQYTGFDPNADTRDGIHPNPAGEEKMARVWMSALARVLSRNP